MKCFDSEPKPALLRALCILLHCPDYGRIYFPIAVASFLGLGYFFLYYLVIVMVHCYLKSIFLVKHTEIKVSLYS